MRFLWGALFGLALIGAGCSRATPPATEAPTGAPATGAAREAAAPAVSEEPKAPPLPSTLSSPPLVPAQVTPSAQKPAAATPSRPTPVPATSPAPAPETHAVTIQNFSFAPATLTVKVGDTVVWTQEDSVSHTVTSDTGSELSSPLLTKGKTFAHTFTKRGTFSYHCTPHPSMKANVIVE